MGVECLFDAGPPMERSLVREAERPRGVAIQRLLRVVEGGQQGLGQRRERLRIRKRLDRLDPPLLTARGIRDDRQHRGEGDGVVRRGRFKVEWSE